MAIFKRKYIDLILQGKKTQTRRISRYRLKIGKAYAVRSKMLEQAQGQNSHNSRLETTTL